MLVAVEEALAKRWTMQDELLAELVELTSAMYVAFLHAHTKESHRWLIPRAVRVPRPNEPKAARRSWLELARTMTGRR